MNQTPLTDDWVIEQHWLQQARHCPSPNFNLRPANTAPTLIVIHNISLPPGQFGGPYIDQFFCNQLDPRQHAYFDTIAKMQVSSHFLIRRDGELVQYVGCDQRAWHAGQSCYRDQQNCNDFSIGIELEGTDDLPYDAIQYQQLATLVTTLIAHYPTLDTDHITGHSDIAPERKTDPGPAFQWSILNKALHFK